jgi:signal transduction histidine kinase
MRVQISAVMLTAVCLWMFSWRFVERRWPRFERALWIAAGIGLVGLFSGADSEFEDFRLLLQFAVATLVGLNSLLFIFFAWRDPRRERALLILPLLLLPIAAVHEVLVANGLIADTPVFSYVMFAFTLSLAIILGLRFAHGQKRIERFNEELAENLTRTRAELVEALERDHARALTNARLQDRLQLAHDLHDGMGGALVHMMASVQHGDGMLPKPKVMSMLKLIHDDLRQTIDGSAQAEMTVPASPREWIAPLRHRFTTLFDELGVASDWRFPPAWRTRPSALQCLALTRLTEEALTNVVKHSRARRVQLSCEQPEAGALVLRIEDNGAGFDVEAVRRAGAGIGMRSMAVRIARVEGTLDVTSEPGRTVLTARLALGAAASPDAQDDK